MRDIVDDIDALVDEQLQQEPSGYDHNINQSQCWHCGRDFHGLPITERMEQMRREYHYTGNVEHLAEYRYAEDDSAILCLGSTAIGPARPGSRRWYFEEDAGLVSAAYVRHALGLSMPWIPDVANVRDAALALLRDGGLLQARSFPRPRWWRLDDPDPRLEIEVRTEFESGLDDYGRGEMYREAPRRWVLVLHDHATGGLEEVELYRSPGGDVYRVTFEDPQRPNRIIRVEIFAERPPRRGGAWVELDDNVEPASLPQHRMHTVRSSSYRSRAWPLNGTGDSSSSSFASFLGGGATSCRSACLVCASANRSASQGIRPNSVSSRSPQLQHRNASARPPHFRH